MGVRAMLHLMTRPLQVRGYLWAQPFISRYNEDGKKSKSKGNHIWNIDAKKVPPPNMGWIFRKYKIPRRIPISTEFYRYLQLSKKVLQVFSNFPWARTRTQESSDARRRAGTCGESRKWTVVSENVSADSTSFFLLNAERICRRIRVPQQLCMTR